MADEIVQYKDRDGLSIVLTPQDVISCCASVSAGTQLTQRDVVNFMATCRALGANPYLGDVYLVKYGSDNASIIAGKNYYTRVAVTIPTYDGTQAGIVCVTNQGEIVYRSGSLALPGDTCIGGWAEVFDKRWSHPVRAEVAIEEYNTHRSLWKSKPLTMIRKVALVQALREAYPDRFAGTYDSSEMGRVGEATPPETQPVAAQVAPPQPTDEDKQRMAKLVDRAVELGYDREEVRGYIWESFKSGGMSAVQQWAATITEQEPVSDSKPEFTPEGDEAALSPDDIEF